MPTPQENSLSVEQASCLFLRMLQDISKKLQAEIDKSARLDPVKGDCRKVQATRNSLKQLSGT